MFAGQVDRRRIVAARLIFGGACIQYGNIFVFEYGSKVVSGCRDNVVTLHIYVQRGKLSSTAEPEINGSTVIKSS